MSQISITQACKLANISRPTLYKYVNNGLLSVVKDGKNVSIDVSELIRVFPNAQLTDCKDSVKSLHDLTIEIQHKNELIDILKQQLIEKQKTTDFLQQQLTQLNNNFTHVNKLLEDKTSTKRRKWLGIF